MSFWDYRDAPPYVVSTGTALSLRAKTIVPARARIDGLLATARDVVCFESALGISEPGDGRLFGHGSGVETGIGPRDDVAHLVERAGHTLGPAARRAWDQFGAPRYIQMRRDSITWEWRELTEPAAYAFAIAHATEGARAHLRWRFRLCPRAETVVGEPYPPSELWGWLSDGKPTASFNLVLPHVAATREFFADWDAICAALTLRLPASRFLVSHPSSNGDRVFRKMQMQ